MSRTRAEQAERADCHDGIDNEYDGGVDRVGPEAVAWLATPVSGDYESCAAIRDMGSEPCP